MATAILEDISPEMVPLSLKTNRVLPSDLKEPQSPEPVPMLDWKAMLSPSRQSCIKLSNVEPCVNKAVSHLTSLKDRLTDSSTVKNRPLITTLLQEAHLDSRKVSSSTESRLYTPKPILVQKDNSSRLSSGQTPQLMVEGITTGIPVEKQIKPSGTTKNESEKREGWPDGEGVISSTLSLIAWLELDRQDTIESLCQERVRVQQLGEDLDRECERRLDLLEVAVQKEHEECMQDLQELKWHVHLETRTLNKVLGELKLVVDKNERLKSEVDKMTKNSPLLEEKLIIENDHMAEIAHTQQETSDQLNKAKHKLMQTEDKSSKAHGRADSERQQMEIALDGIRAKLLTAKKKLKESRLDATAMTHQINNNLKKITENEKRARDLDEKRGKSVVLQSTVDTRVGLLKDDYVQMDMEHRRQEQRIENLHKQKEEENSKLESEHIVLKSAMQTAERRLRQARDKSLEMEQENDSLTERIAAFTKQTQDDEKSVERAHRELVKLDQQLGVSMAQFTEIRDSHFNASEEFKSEQAKAGDVEHTLRASIQKLQQQIKDQTRTKVTYSGKVNAVSAELEKVRAESKRKEERVGRLARESEKQSKGQMDKVAKTEENHSGKAKLLDSLQSELSSVQAQQNEVEQKVGGRRDNLATDEKQLRGEVQEKVTVVNSVSDRINLLERKLEDVVKSTAMLDKMEGVTNATIEQLNDQLSLLKEKLAAERKEEQSWRDELREISDFSSDADQKHTTYLKERTQLLKQYKLDLHKALSTNASLAEHYRQQQVKFIQAKTLALRVIERKLEMESSLRDHKQLLAFQSCIYSTMKAYYEHRGVSCRRQVVQFHSQSKENMQQLRSLREQFETVIAMMHEFLENGFQKRTRSRSMDHATVRVS